MARNFGVVGTEGQVALVADTAKTVLQLRAATNHMVAVLAVRVSFDGVSATGDPVQIELKRQTTAGTMTAVTARKTRVGGPALQTSGGKNATAEPTDSDILREWEIHPQSGAEISLELGAPIEVDSAGRIGLDCVSPNNGVNMRAEIDFEE